VRAGARVARVARVARAARAAGTAVSRASAAAAVLALTASALAGCGTANRAAGGSHPGPSRSSDTGTGHQAPAPSYDWLRSDSAALGLGGGTTSTLSDILAPGVPTGGWLIVGTRTAADGTTTATVWTSGNATQWQATSLPGADGQAFAAARWGTHTIVVGSLGTGTDQHAAVWISPGKDQPFTAVPDQATFAGRASETGATGATRMTMVGAATDGVYAVGAADGGTAVWYSTNGTTWQQEPSAERLLNGVNATVTSLSVSGGGATLTGDITHGTERVGALWSSSDGISWQQHSTYQPFDGPGDDVLNDRLSLYGSVLVVGAVRDGPDWQPATWLSPNGEMWGEPNEALPATAAPGGEVIRAAALGGGHIVAVGGSATTQELWMAGIGARLWREVALPAPIGTAGNWSADLVATNGPKTIIIDSQPGQPHVLVGAGGHWTDVTKQPGPFGRPRTIVTPVGLAHAGHRLVLLADVDRPAAAIGGASHFGAVALGSTDGGRTWRRLSDGPGWADVRLQGLTSVKGHLVAVGDQLSPSGASDGVGMWTSANGSRWSQFGSGTGAGLDAAAVAAVDGRAVAVGSASLGSGSGSGVFGSAGSGSGGSDSSDLGGAGSGGVTGAAGWTAASGWSDAQPLGGPAAGASRAVGACADGTRAVAVGQATRDSRPPTAVPAGSASTGSSTSSSSTIKGKGGRAGTSTTTTTEPKTGSEAGPIGQSDQGTLAVAWSSRDGNDWLPATVAPMTGVGAQATMTGCLRVGSRWVAYGAAPDTTGPAVPAVWTSPTGTAWTAVTPTGPAGDQPGSFTDLTASGSTWTAVSGGLIPALSSSANPATVADDPLSATAPTTAATGTNGGSTNGGTAIWRSVDGGRSWSRLDTSGPAWTVPGGQTAADLVTGQGRDLLVVGIAGGRLEVWTGTRG